MATSQRRLPKEEIARRGDEIFDRDIRPTLHSDDEGKFVAIDVETGDFEIDAGDMSATNRLRERLPDAQIWITRVGYNSVRRYGPRRRTPQ